MNKPILLSTISKIQSSTSQITRFNLINCKWQTTVILLGANPAVLKSDLNFQNAHLQQFPSRDWISCGERRWRGDRFQFVDKLRNDRECLVLYGQIDAVIESTPQWPVRQWRRVFVVVGGGIEGGVKLAASPGLSLTRNTHSTCCLVNFENTDQNRLFDY